MSPMTTHGGPDPEVPAGPVGCEPSGGSSFSGISVRFGSSVANLKGVGVGPVFASAVDGSNEGMSSCVEPGSWVVPGGETPGANVGGLKLGPVGPELWPAEGPGDLVAVAAVAVGVGAGVLLGAGEALAPTDGGGGVGALKIACVVTSAFVTSWHVAS